jgi:hypothetical protein
MTTMVLLSICIVSYDQRYLLISLLIMSIHHWGRTYTWVTDSYRYIRMNVFFDAAFMLIYIISRAF